MDSHVQSVVDRGVGDARDIHGGPGHFGCKRRAAAHCRQLISHAGRSNLGVDELPRLKRDHPARRKLVGKILWPQTISDRLHPHLYGVVGNVRCGGEPGPADCRAHCSGRRRRRAPTDRTGGPDGKFSARKARLGNGGFRLRRGGCADHWANARRLDHR